MTPERKAGLQQALKLIASLSSLVTEATENRGPAQDDILDFADSDVESLAALSRASWEVTP
jgi:hypothetical protein